MPINHQLHMRWRLETRVGCAQCSTIRDLSNVLDRHNGNVLPIADDGLSTDESHSRRDADLDARWLEGDVWRRGGGGLAGWRGEGRQNGGRAGRRRWRQRWWA